MAITTTYALGTIRSEFVANSGGTGNFQSLSNVIRLAGGGFALTYATENGANDLPYVSIYNSVTGAVSPLFLPYDVSVTNMVGEPVIAQLLNGNLVVVWKEGSGGSNAIVRTIFNPVTQAVVGAKEVVVSSAAGNTDPEIASLKNAGINSGYVITYGTAGGGINTEVYNPTGTFINSAVVASSGAGATDSAVIVTADGGFVVVFVSAGIIYSSTYSAEATGGTLKTEVTGGTNSSPQVAALKGGGFAIVYDDANFGGQPGIGLKLSTAAEDVVIRVDTADGAKGDRDPEITVLDNGFILVTWTHEFSATDHDIYARVFTAEGTPVDIPGSTLTGSGGVFTVDTSSLNETQSSVAALFNGMFVTTWTDAAGDGDVDGISGRVQELTRTITSDTAGDSLTGDQLRDDLVGNGGEDTLTGGAGNDVYRGGAGSDRLVVQASDGTNGIETLDGGSEVDTLVLDKGTEISFTFDLRDDAITSIEAVTVTGQFPVVTDIRLLATQFGAGISTMASFNNPTALNPRLIVDMGAVTSLNLGSLTMDGGYTVIINGDGDGEDITGSSRGDILFGNGGADTLDGGAGADTLDGGEGNDTLFGGVGNDVYVVDSLNDVINELDGGRTPDTADEVRTTLSSFTLGPTAGNVNIENLTFIGTGAFTGTGDGGANSITGGAAGDMLDGGTGNDSLQGGAGNDTLQGSFFSSNGFINTNEIGNGIGEIYDGGADTDTLVIRGGNGNSINFRDDTLMGLEILHFDGVLSGGVSGVFLASQFTQFTTVSAVANTAALTQVDISMAGSTSLDLSALNVSAFSQANANILIRGDGDAESITGSSGADSIIGSGGNDRLTGLGGNDMLDGGAGVDSVDGGAGEDTVIAGDGVDVTSGGADRDRLDLRGVGVDVSFNMVTGATNGFGTHTLYEDVLLGAGNDTVTGTDGRDIINGGRGNDSLVGGAGFDRLKGDSDSLNTGNDTLDGGGGNDQLDDFAGAVSLFGGDDNDTIFLFHIAGAATTGTIDGGAGLDLLGLSDILGLSGPTHAALQGATLTGLEELFIAVNTVTATAAQFEGFDRILLSSSLFIEGANLILAATGAATTLDLSDELADGDQRKVNLTGSTDNEALTGGARNDTIFGGIGNDTLTGGTGDDTLDGGADTDTVTFTGARANYTIVAIANGFTVTDTRGAGFDGVDTVLNAETFVFTDQTRTSATLINAPPTAPALAGNIVAENAGAGTVVGTLSATDPDGNPVTFTLDAAGTTLFNLTGNQLSLKAGANIDFEAGATRTFTAFAADPSGAQSAGASLTLNITNVNEAPTTPSLAGNIVAENAGAGTVVGTLSASDPDGTTPGFQIVGGSGASLFAISGNTLVVAPGAVLDFEAGATRDVQVISTDGALNSAAQSFTINLNNVNETPTAPSLAGNTVSENSAAGTVVGTLSATDPDGTAPGFQIVGGSGASLFAISGNTLVVAPGAVLDFEAGATRDVQVIATDGALNSAAQSFTINLTDVGEGTNGGDGPDIMIGTPAPDHFNGLGGNDILIGDGPLSLTSAAASIRRLYIATLDRAPDAGGWQGWVTELGNGRPLTEIAGGFVGSDEFQTKYGTLDNPQFVQQLYRNVLDREADAGGLAAFTDALNSGALTRTQVVVNFSESNEFINGTAPSLHAGQIFRLYGATLARAPDTAGFEGWTDIMGGGRGLVDIAGGFVGSNEFQTTYGSLDNTAFVTLLYQNVLGRAPDEAGLAGWRDLLDSGALSRTQVVTGFSESGEYINGTRAATDAFMRNVMVTWSDTLVGGAGDDRLTGGRGSDRYVFTASEASNDTIFGFESFDTLQLTGFGFADPAAALGTASQQGSNVVLGYNGGSITFADTQLSVLQSVTAQGWVLG